MHGLIWFLIGAYLVLFRESIEKDKGSLFRPLVVARYLIVLMGFFAFYNGIIYNDFTSISFNFFHSCYSPNYALNFSNELEYLWEGKGCVYAFGLDPIWSKS